MRHGQETVRDRRIDVTARVVLVGGGGHARSVADAVSRLGGRVVAIVDPDATSGASTMRVDTLDALDSAAHDVPHLVSIGANVVRARVTQEVRDLKRPVGLLVAATATVGGDVGRGSQVLEHAHVGPGATVGEGVIVNTGATVEHDVSVESFCHVAPGARVLGGARIGRGTLVGAGAVVLPGVVVGAWAVIGAGSVVVRDVRDAETVVGAPGRVVRGSDTAANRERFH